jgi:hypothetical protein
VLTPADLKGKRVGIRSFTTTTGAWIRGILANDYGVDLDSIRWITFEEPHVAEYVDTSERAPRARRSSTCCWRASWTPCLGERSDDARLATLFADPAAEAESLVRPQAHRADQPRGGGEREARQAEALTRWREVFSHAEGEQGQGGRRLKGATLISAPSASSYAQGRWRRSSLCRPAGLIPRAYAGRRIVRRYDAALGTLMEGLYMAPTG